MSRSDHLASWVQTALMTLGAALLFVGVFRLNDLLFSFMEYADRVNWVFVPAGFRVLLVLIMGLPGATGIALGTLWLDWQDQTPMGTLEMLLTALVSGFGPWLVKVWMQARGEIDPGLCRLHAASLLKFVAVYAILNAVAHQSVRWSFDATAAQPWLDIAPMFTGDLLGAALVLYVFKLSLPALRVLAQRRPL